MKKILLMLTLLISVVVSANAQIAIEKSSAFDNIGFGVTAGVSTPLDFNSVFSLNSNAGVKVTKDFTTVFGVQAEGLAVLNDNHFTDIKTSVKATNIGANAVFNLTNIMKGYAGTPRTFEIKTVTGLGWLHTWNTSLNYLTGKTGLDFSLNIGKKKAHSVVLTPAIYWNLNRDGNIKFDKHDAQLAVNLSYIYHFKNSNGTHSFKTWDIGAMMNEISYLQGKLDECESKQPLVVEQIREVERVVTVPSNPWVIQFAQNSSELTYEAKAILDTINRDLIVDVVGTASPEGEAEHNQRLSESRAAKVADYLTKRGIRVNSWAGKGVQIGEATNRLAIVTITKG